MIIKDTQKLLPTQIRDNWEMSDMVLEIPPHGIPLHSKSVETLVAAVKSGKKAVAFRPILPVSSELGLPQYPTLAYLYPQELSKIWSQLLQEFESKNQGVFGIPTPLTIICQTDPDEQSHYFADYYGTAVKPSYVRAIVGNTCNLKCVMCPYHSSLLKPTHTTDFFTGNNAMSWEIMEKLAQECGEQGITILIGSVEEPLLHPKIIDFVRLCRQQGVPRVHITTNGQLLDESRAIALLKAGLTSIDISIDAAEPDTYLRVRGANLNQVESNIINFLRLRDRLKILCEVRTSFVRNQDVTIEEEEKFRERWLAKADSVFVLNLAEYKETNMRLSKTNDALQDSLNHYIQKAQGRWACLFPFIEMAVLPDGRIYYCIETLFKLGFDKDIASLGDYNKQTLQDIWSGNFFNQLRRDLILNKLDNRSACKNCDMWKSQVINRAFKNRLQVTTTMVTEIYQRTDSKVKT
ncbi:MAG: radical SAM protein [Nostoc sp. DedSLP03]|uniref:radical SAM/SPASM domain-containing protein n=1 Tax=Nostoc sp. DedSLP03 TaxID=3075400 RepID=UPI002AD28B92|nr:radical SAM protein [Nostoc sp. DedSLP03]MDZ7969788.1 radical SAM protein [Nostoc sp. DedSLP03]